MESLQSMLARLFMLLFALVVSMGSAHALDACASGQKPWAINPYPPNDPAGAVGDTQEAACAAMVGAMWAGATWTGWSFTGGICYASGHPNPSGNGSWSAPVQVCEPGQLPPDPEPGTPGQIRIDAVDGHVGLTVQVGTQTIVVTPEPVSDERIADMGELFMLFLFAGLVVFCSRSLYDLVRSDTVRD